MNNWIPPKSPFDLLQERFWPDEWKILVVCLLFNLTSRKQIEPMITGFFEKYPDPKSMIAASEEELRCVLKPLGLVNKRVKTLKRFSIEFLEKEWKTAKDLYGCGKYADDTWRIFCLGDYVDLEPHDHALVDYHGFLMSDVNFRGSSYA